MAFLCILWPFGNLHSGNLVYLSPFWYVVSRKIWHPELLVLIYFFHRSTAGPTRLPKLNGFHQKQRSKIGDFE
jgi:hypothetical protein